MANDLEASIRNAAASVAQYVKDASILTVETRFVEVGGNGQGADFAKAMPVASTTIKLDGDSAAVLPMHKNEAGVLEVDSDLFNMHLQNVSTAIEYRARILNALLGTLLNKG